MSLAKWLRSKPVNGPPANIKSALKISNKNKYEFFIGSDTLKQIRIMNI